MLNEPNLPPLLPGITKKKKKTVRYARKTPGTRAPRQIGALSDSCRSHAVSLTDVSSQGDIYTITAALIDPTVLNPLPFRTPLPNVRSRYGQGPVMDDIRSILGEFERQILSCVIQVGEDRVFKVFWVPSGRHRNSFAYHHLNISFYGCAVALLMDGGMVGSFRDVTRAHYSWLWSLQHTFLTQVAGPWVSTHVVPVEGQLYQAAQTDLDLIARIDPESLESF